MHMSRDTPAQHRALHTNISAEPSLVTLTFLDHSSIPFWVPNIQMTFPGVTDTLHFATSDPFSVLCQ